MYDMMAGVKVIEVAEHTFVPVAAMILGDWGADVIKVERSGGDPSRNLGIPNSSKDGRSIFFEAPNRGKRSIALDLRTEEGRALLYKMVETADVFVTNLRQDARIKLGIEPEDIMGVNPRIIYARGTGYGTKGDMAHDGGFDFPSMWCRSSAAYMQTVPGREPAKQPASVGDLGGGATTAGAIAAALFRRERTGKGAIVDNSLYLFGIYIMSQMITGTGLGLTMQQPRPLEEDVNPLVSMFETSDGRWLSICLLMPQWWPDFAERMGHPEWIEDPRFATPQARMENSRALRDQLVDIFRSRDFAWWKQELDKFETVWAPLQSPAEVAADPQALANGYILEVETSDGWTYQGGATPAQFDEQPLGTTRAAPGYGEHSDAVLAEYGFGADEIAALRARGVVQ